MRTLIKMRQETLDQIHDERERFGTVSESLLLRYDKLTEIIDEITERTKKELEDD